MSSESYPGYPECVVSCHGAGRLANSIGRFVIIIRFPNKDRLLKGRASGGVEGYGLAQGERTSGKAAGEGHGGTDAGGGKGRLIFLYSLLPRSCIR
jgi:hypothetical protein